MADSPFDRTEALGDQYATLGKDVSDLGKLQHLIPGFEVLEELGRGAFGVVYLARDEQLDRKVAIKVPLFDDPESREQYVKEAQNAARLDIDGVVPVFQVGTLASGQPFVVQRLIEGSTLRQELKESGKLSPHRACILMAEIAGVVARAHQKELIHRDLKPDNILIDADGKPWVADFGLAIFEEDQYAHRGERAGTPVYMAPEQFRGRADWLDGRTDIYSMGVMLYEMLVGRTPFDAKTLPELEEQVLHRDPKPISQRAPHLPADLDLIFQNCCAKQVNDRYSNAFELVADLEAILPDMSDETPRSSRRGSAQSSGVITLRSKQAGKTTRRNSQVLAAREKRPARKRFLSIVVPLGLSAVAGLISVALLWSAANQPSDRSTLGSDGDNKADEVPTPVIPARPFRVATSGGTHTTIGAALAMAEEGETIVIRPGIYNENLSISRSIKLVGEGKRDDVIINGESDSAVRITKPVKVELQNLNLEASASSSRQFNTVHVQAGSVELLECRVISNSWDCVRLEPGCELTAKKCRFQSRAHPAICAKDAKAFDIAECDFDIRPQTLEGKFLPYGLQADNSRGRIRESTFHGGPGAIGVQWQNTDELVAIENCIFQECERGVVVQNCRNVSITGNSLARPTTKVIGCAYGIQLEDSSAELTGIEIRGAGATNGIQIQNKHDNADRPLVQISDCKISGYEHSVTADNAHVILRAVEIDSSQLGIFIESMSDVTLTDCQLLNSNNKGASDNKNTHSVAIKIGNASASLERCAIEWHYVGVEAQGKNELTLTDCQLQGNFIGLNVAAGNIRVKDGVFDTNDFCAITIAPEATEQQPRSLTDTHAQLHFERTAFEDSKQCSFKFFLPCTLQLTDCSFQGPLDKATPTLNKDLEMVTEGPITTIAKKNP